MHGDHVGALRERDGSFDDVRGVVPFSVEFKSVHHRRPYPVSHSCLSRANTPLARKVFIAASTAAQRSVRFLAKAIPSFSRVGTCSATLSYGRSFASQEITGNSLITSPMSPASRSSSADAIPW